MSEPVSGFVSEVVNGYGLIRPADITGPDGLPFQTPFSEVRINRGVGAVMSPGSEYRFTIRPLGPDDGASAIGFERLKGKNIGFAEELEYLGYSPPNSREKISA